MTYKKQYNIFKKTLGINKIISIRFSNRKTREFSKYNDTACTALARSFNKNTSTYIDRQEGQLCSGGNYFLGITHCSKKEINDVYIKSEKVFKNKKACNSFIKKIPIYPKEAEKKYILISPLIKEEKKPDIVMLLANPAQAGRILGLSSYKEYLLPEIISAQPTCLSVYAPLKSNKIHLNFIDYFDRYYQGKQNGKLLWNDNELIISLSFATFKEITKNIPLSSHGSNKPKIRSKKVDNL